MTLCAQEVVAEIEFWFLQLINIAIETIKTLMNMFFRMIFNMGDFGKFMKGVLRATCTLLDFLLMLWNYTGCQFVKNVLLPMVRSLTYLISSIVSFFGGGRGIVNLMWTIIHYMEMVTCDYHLDCSMDYAARSNIEFGALPVASRCWADYSPELDASDSFSCTRSDTCRVGELNYGTTLDEYGFLKEDGNQIVCDACPLQPGGLVNSFGCDIYTKQCTCNRPKLQRTYCTTHQVCISCL